MKSSTMKIVSGHVRQLRRRRSWSQTELARRAGLAQTLISQLERELKTPTVNTVESIANAFGLPAWALFIDVPDLTEVDIPALSSVLSGYTSLPDSGRREVERVVGAEKRYHATHS